MSKRFELDEDFVGAQVIGSVLYTKSGLWTISGVGTEVVSLQAGELDAPGILRLATGTSSGDTCQIEFGSAPIVSASRIIDFTLRLRCSHTTSISVLSGLFETSLSPVADTGRWLFFDTALDASYQSITSQTTDEIIDTGVAGSTSFRTIRFKSTGDGNLAGIEIFDDDGVALFRDVHTAEFVDNAAVSFGIRVQTLTAASRYVEIDRWTLKTTELSR